MTDDSTNMSDQWVANALKMNPCVLLARSGNILTCPVRLSFPDVFTRAKPVEIGKEGKFQSNLVFPPAADLSLLYEAAEAAAKAKWPNIGQKGGPKIKMPFKNQSDMMDRYDGYAAEGVYLICPSDRKPTVYDQRQKPVTDPERIYPGVWACVSINPFTYDKGVNKGVSFGLNDLMIVADDKRLGGGGSSPSDFAGIKLDASVSGDGVFGGDEDAAAAKLFS